MGIYHFFKITDALSEHHLGQQQENARAPHSFDSRKQPGRQKLLYNSICGSGYAGGRAELGDLRGGEGVGEDGGTQLPGRGGGRDSEAGGPNDGDGDIDRPQRMWFSCSQAGDGQR